jgi:hypothetical protein
LQLLDLKTGRFRTLAAAMVCATSNFPCINRALTEGVICRRALE